MADHILIAKETTAFTPATIGTGDVIPVRSAEPEGGENYIQDRRTGMGRGLSDNNRGSKIPSLSGEGTTVPESFGLLIGMLLGGEETIQVGATTAYNHNFYPIDTAALPTATVQLKQTRGGVTTTIGQKGVKLDSLETTFEVDAVGMYSFEFLAQDEAKAGATYEDGTTSQAAVTPAYPVYPAPFMFTHVLVTYGGTATWDNTDKVFDWTGGTDVVDAVSVGVSISNNIDQGGVLGKRTANRMPEGQRDLEITLTISNDTPSLLFYDKMRAGTQESLRILVRSGELIDTGEYYELEFIFPVVTYEDVSSGEISAEFGMRDIEMTLRGQVQQASGYDVGIRLKDSLTTDYLA